MDSRNSCAYADDYDEACPYRGSSAPDVVYRYAATVDLPLRISLCYSV
jgi:hypothetical protein